MDSAHLLVVDDDERIRALLGRFLRRGGHLVTLALDAARARRLLAGLSFDLIVLDVMMPGEDGVSLCRDLRARGLATPILLLTARGETGDRILGLEAGADDYLAKPFDPKELLLRIAAVLRRAGADGPGAEDGGAAAGGGGRRILRLGPVRYDVERGELLYAAEPPDGVFAGGGPPGRLRLTATEAGLMRVFAAEPGATVSRARLIAELARALGRAGADGSGASDERGDGGLAALAQERAVDVQITRLRRKIEPDPRQPRYLQTVRGEGYRLAPD